MTVQPEEGSPDFPTCFVPVPLNVVSSHENKDSKIQLDTHEDVDKPPGLADAHIIRLLPDEFNMTISNKQGYLLDKMSPDLPDPPEDLASPSLRKLMGHTSAERHPRVFKRQDKDDLVLIRVRKGDPVYMCLIIDHEQGRCDFRYRDDSGEFMDERDIIWLTKYKDFDNRMDAFTELKKKHTEWLENEEAQWKTGMRRWRLERRNIEAMIVHNEVSLGKSYLFTSWADCKSALPALDLFVTRENARDYRREIADVFSSKYENRFYALTNDQIETLEEEAETFFQARRAPNTDLIEIPNDYMTSMSHYAYVRLYNRAAALVDLQRQAEEIEKSQNASGKDTKLCGIELQAKEMSLVLQKKWQMRKYADQIFKRALRTKTPIKDRELRDLIRKWHRIVHDDKYA